MRSISLRFGVDAAKAELDGPRGLGVDLPTPVKTISPA